MSDHDGLYRLLLPGEAHPRERGYPTLGIALDNIAHWLGRMVGRVWVVLDGETVASMSLPTQANGDGTAYRHEEER
jgi:hypothetical protein